MYATESTRLLLRGLRFLSAMPNARQRAFIEAGILRRYAAKCNIFMQGEAADRLFIVMDGGVRLYSKTSARGEAVIALYKRGDVFGEACVFGEAGYPFSAETREASYLLEIPGGVLRERAGSGDQPMASLLHSLSREMRSLQAEGARLACLAPRQRVASLLVHLSEGMPGAGGTFNFPCRRAVAAARLGMEAGIFSRALEQLRPFGVTVNGAEVTIKSFSRLAACCAGVRPAQKKRKASPSVRVNSAALFF